MQEYIQVDIEQGLNFTEISDALRVLSLMSGLFQYLMVQVYTGTCNLSYNQLLYIIAVAKKLIQNNASLGKTAFVVNNGLQSGIARLFIEGISDTVCSFDVFQDQRRALAWLFKP